jgi:crotonobetainyl-CoA:carnitine CoA-transferase CaiB-like acyl-CoA transferase
MCARLCAALAQSTPLACQSRFSRLIVLESLPRARGLLVHATTFADLGAEVIKVEKPGSGDDTRAWGPPFLKDRSGRDTGEAAYYLACNRGKKSVAVDFTQRDGQSIVRDLAKTADVIVENFKVGGLARYALDYPSLEALNPRLVYCSITGFGQTATWARRLRLHHQGMGGSRRYRKKTIFRAAARKGPSPFRSRTGMYTATAILAALAHRDGAAWASLDLSLMTRVAMMAVMNRLSRLRLAAPPGGSARTSCHIKSSRVPMDI